MFHCPNPPLQTPLLSLHLPAAFPSALHAKRRDVRASAVGGCGATAGAVGVALNFEQVIPVAERRGLLQASHEAVCVWVTPGSVGIEERLNLNIWQEK